MRYFNYVVLRINMERRDRIFSTLLLITLLFIPLSAFSQEQSIQNPYEAAYDELIGMQIDTSKMAYVTSFLFQHENASFAFEEGKLYLCKPVMGETCAAIFVGKGTFAFSPPTIIEREQLERYYEKKAVSQSFTSVFMLFSDSTYSTLAQSQTFHSADDISAPKKKIKKFLECLSEKNPKPFKTDILRTLLNHDHSGLFFADIEDAGMAFLIDPYSAEEDQFLKMTPNNTGGQEWELINQYPRLLPGVPGIAKEMLTISGYKLDCSFANTHDLDFTAKAEIAFTLNMDNPRWLQFSLYPKLGVDSITWSDGSNAIFWNGENDRNIWIRCDSPLHKNDSAMLQIFYSGKIMKRMDELAWIGVESPNEWYPRYGDKMSAIFDLTFHYPSRYILAAIGDRVSFDSSSHAITSRWVTSTPVHYASFNIGKFTELNLNNDSLPEIKILYSKEAQNAVHIALGQANILTAGDMENRIGEEVQQSIKLYRSLFGECPVKTLYVTQVPYPHGISFPGLIHLSWMTFQMSNSEGWNEVFRAHEVAHQWLGNSIGIDSYHDAWLSEGIAQYCGLLFMQLALKDNAKYFDMLTSWKNDILSDRKYLLGSGQEAGPIWLGNRTESASTAGDYDLLIYKKGGWVLHMLRNILIDLKTMNEDKFNGILKDFYTTYKGKSATTQDFQQIVEKHIGAPMDWFFNEWIYDTRTPKYKFAYKTEATPDGKYKVSCKVQTEGVGKDFQMFVPLYIDFGNKKFVRLRVAVIGLQSHFDLPLLPLEPKEIKFNDLQSVLCEFETVKWDDIQ